MTTNKVCVPLVNCVSASNEVAKKRLKKAVEPDDEEHKTKEQLEREIAEIEAKLNPKKAKKPKMRKRDLKKADKVVDANHKLAMESSHHQQLQETERLETKETTKSKKKTTNLTDAECQTIASELAQKMQRAVEEDNANNVKKLPALKKYLLVEEVAR